MPRFLLWLILNSLLLTTVYADSLNEKIQAVKASLSVDQKQQDALQTELQSIELSLSQINTDIATVNKAQKNEAYLINKLQSSEKDTHLQLVLQREALAAQVKAAYLLGQPNEIKIILNQENPSTLYRHLNYYKYLMRNHVSLVNDIRTSLDALAHTLQNIATHQKTLQNLLIQKEEQQKKLQSQQLLRQALITQLNQTIQTHEQQLAALTANQEALQKTISQLQKQNVIDINNRSFSQLRGKLSWPIQGNILRSFGSRLDVADLRLTGVIIGAPFGSPVRAIAAGKVIFANWLRGFGLLVIIDHGNGYMSLYARNQTLGVTPGERIESGQVIAATGNSGGFTSPGLYFEIRQNGIPQNPASWCRFG